MWGVPQPVFPKLLLSAINFQSVYKPKDMLMELFKVLATEALSLTSCVGV